MRKRSFIMLSNERYKELKEKEKIYDSIIQAFFPCVMDAIEKAFEKLEQEEKEN